MKRIGLNAGAAKFASEVFCAVFGAAEDEAQFIVLRLFLVLLDEIKE